MISALVWPPLSLRFRPLHVHHFHYCCYCCCHRCGHWIVEKRSKLMIQTHIELTRLTQTSFFSVFSFSSFFSLCPLHAMILHLNRLSCCVSLSSCVSPFSLQIKRNEILMKIWLHRIGSECRTCL